MNSHTQESGAVSVDRLDVTKRLQSEGRFEAAGLFRETCRRKLRASGVARAEALERAWQETVQRFPPLRALECELRPVIALVTVGDKAPNGTDATFAEVWRIGWLAIAGLYSAALENQRGQAYVTMELKRVATEIGQEHLVSTIKTDAIGYLIHTFASACRKVARAIGDEQDTSDTLLRIGQRIQELKDAKTRRQVLRLIGGSHR